MLRLLQLLLPALLPSWRFFDYIAPSPRIQYALLDTEQSLIVDWQEFQPRPGHVSVATLLRRLLWNPHWNESLFMISCAERILEQHTTHSENEIMTRILDSLRNQPGIPQAPLVQFRLVLIERQNGALVEQVHFHSQAVILAVVDKP